MSGVRLGVRQCYGINPQIKNSIAFADDHLVAYACGHQVVIFNTETRDQSFINLNVLDRFQSLGISAIGSSSMKKLVAVAEKADPVGIVAFYDPHSLKRKKTLHYADLGSREIRCISFSDDGRFCLTQGAGPEWNLVLWNVEKAAKVVAVVKISQSEDNPVHQVSFCPWDSNIILVIGKAIVKMFKIAEGQLRPITLSSRRENANFITHCWLPDHEKVILGTEAGELYIIEGQDIRYLTVSAGGDFPGDELRVAPILSLASTSRGGFLVGTTEGELRIFEKQDDVKDPYGFVSAVHIAGGKGAIAGLLVGADDSLVCALNTQQILAGTLGQLNTKDKETHVVLENLLTSFHAPNAQGDASITGIDVALWKNVVVTCGRDRTIRVWNPNEKKVEMTKDFDDEPLCLSVHPSGTLIAVAFADRIRILSVLLDELAVTRTIQCRNSNVVKFSKGGHFLATLNGSNIQIYNVYSGNLVTTLRGHPSKIRSMQWMNLDARLLSIGVEGGVFFWDILPLNNNQAPDFYNARAPLLVGSALQDGTKAFVATPDKVVKEVRFTRAADPLTVGMSAAAAGNIAAQNANAAAVAQAAAPAAGEGQAASESRESAMEFPGVVGQMIVDESRKLLIMCTGDVGVPNSILLAMTSPSLTQNLDVATIHSGPITAICQSYDGLTLYTGDVHGCLIVSEFETEPGGGKVQVKTRESAATFEFVDEVMIHKTDLEQRKRLIAELTSKVEDLTLSNEHQLRLKETEHKDRVKDITTKFTAQLDVEKEKYDAVMLEKRDMEAEHSAKMETIRVRHKDELLQIDVKYKTKLNAEANRHKTLINETEETHKRWNEENKALVESHQTYLQELTANYEERLRVEQALQKKLQLEKDSMQVQYESDRNYLEEDADLEIDDMRARHEERLKKEEELGLALQAQHGAMKKEFSMLLKDAEQQREDIKRLKDKEARLQENIRNLEKDIQSHKKEIREREETITDKEKRIFDLKKKNQELEKFRFVLDYKIKELKLQIAPRENEIATMRKQVEEMDLELEQYHKSNLALNLMISELKLKLEGLRRELLAQNERMDSNSRLMNKIKRDLQDLYEYRDDPHALKPKMVNIYRVYVQEDMAGAKESSAASSSGKAGEDPQLAYNRDREQMERSLDAIRRALKTDATSHRRDLAKMMRENVMLTKELNALRKEAGLMMLQKKAIDEAGPMGPKSDPTALAELLDLLGIKTKKAAAPGSKLRPSAAAELELGSTWAGSSTADKRPSSEQNVMITQMGQAEEPDDAADSPSKGHKVQRSAALRTTSASGRVQGGAAAKASKHDQWEAWREVQMQMEQMRQLEDQLHSVCRSMGVDPVQILINIDVNLQSLST